MLKLQKVRRPKSSRPGISFPAQGRTASSTLQVVQVVTLSALYDPRTDAVTAEGSIVMPTAEGSSIRAQAS